MKELKEVRKMYKTDVINGLKYDANSPKEELMRIAAELYDIGAVREAKTLETIIGKLEAWQDK